MVRSGASIFLLFLLPRNGILDETRLLKNGNLAISGSVEPSGRFHAKFRPFPGVRRRSRLESRIRAQLARPGNVRRPAPTTSSSLVMTSRRPARSRRDAEDLAEGKKPPPASAETSGGDHVRVAAATARDSNLSPDRTTTGFRVGPVHTRRPRRGPDRLRPDRTRRHVRLFERA